MSQPFRELCAARKRGEFRHEKYHKRLENIADNAGGQVTVAQVVPPTGLTEIQQNPTILPSQSFRTGIVQKQKHKREAVRIRELS